MTDASSNSASISHRKVPEETQEGKTQGSQLHFN